MRKLNVDLVKFIGVFIVICVHFHYDFSGRYIHADSINYYTVIRTLFSIAVPIFLITSGYLIINKEYSYKQLFIKVVQLYILSLIYKFISLLVMGGEVNLKNVAMIIFNSHFVGDNLSEYKTNYIWYIYPYIGILIIQPLFRALYQRKREFTTFAFVIILYSFILFYFKHLFVEYFKDIDAGVVEKTFPLSSTYPFVYAFFLSGGLFKMYERSIIEKLQKYFSYRILVYILFFIGLAGAVYLQLYVGNKFDIYDNPVTYHYRTLPGFIMSSTFFIILMYLVPTVSNKYITFVSKESLGIYFVHWPISYLIKGFAIENGYIDSILDDIAISAIILVICSVVVYLLLKIKGLKHLVKV